MAPYHRLALKEKPMCDTLVTLTASGSLLAKNSDRDPTEAQVLRGFPRFHGPDVMQKTQYLEIYAAPTSAVVGSQPSWLWGFEHGVNEHKLAIGNERVWTPEPSKDSQPGLIGTDLVRLALERAQSASEAVHVIGSLVEAFGQGGSAMPNANEPYSSSFLIADPYEAWILETNDRAWAAKRVQAPGASISNYLTLSGPLDRASKEVSLNSDFTRFADPTMPPSIGYRRMACTAKSVGTCDAAQLAATLRDHGNGPWGSIGETPSVPPSPPSFDFGEDFADMSVCMHVPGVRTTSSMVVDLPQNGEVVVHAALGNPCVSMFVPFMPFADLAPPADNRRRRRRSSAAPTPAFTPTVLGDESIWRRFAAQSDRIEQDPALLLPVRQACAAAESKLLTIFHESHGESRDQRDADLTNAVHSLLESLDRITP